MADISVSNNKEYVTITSKVDDHEITVYLDIKEATQVMEDIHKSSKKAFDVILGNELKEF